MPVDACSRPASLRSRARLLSRAAVLGALLVTAAIAPACVAASHDVPVDEQADQEVDANGQAITTPVVTDDNLNGLWVATVGGQKQPNDVVIESWSAIGIRLHWGGQTLQLTRTGDHLAGAGVTLDVKPNKAGVKDDTFDGTVGGATVHLARDTAPKPPITLTFPGDRPYRSWLVDTLAPLAQQDRESYVHMQSDSMLSFLTSCELWKHGSWLRQYFKGATFTEQAKSFKNVAYAMNGHDSTPRQMTSDYTFSHTLQANLADASKVALAMSTFSMYFTTAAGRALRLPMTAGATGYFITDRPTRAERIGLVVMSTPTHGPLASTFGRQLLDLGAMPAIDDALYARAMMELFVKSDNRGAAALSGTGQSALTDWFSVMAIEDYRGVAFGWPGLGWGTNMTDVQFYGLVVRALARPGAVDDAGKPVLGQVVVSGELRPGDPSYADVLNGGNDMQEYADMASLKQSATSWLRAAHPQEMAAVEAAFANVVPKSELDARAQVDVFHFVTAQLYDASGRTANLKGASANAAIDAVVALFDVMKRDSAAFEAYLLSHGYTKSNAAAPKSTGF
jgi:hypothetical protein